MIPGEYFIEKGDVECNVGYRTVTLTAVNTGDRPVQIGSHFHFFEVNRMMSFDRAKAFNMRLNIAAGTAVRFEPGQGRTVELVEIAGRRRVYGFRGQVMGALDSAPSRGTKAVPKADRKARRSS